MPDWKALVRARLTALGLSPTREADVTEELALHLEERYRELIAEGTDEPDAVARTLETLNTEALTRRMGRLDRSHTATDARPVPGAASGGVLLDLRHAMRGLRRHWGFTTVAVLTLACGIGANAAIFSAVRTILFRPLPFRDSSRLVNVWLLRSGRPNWHFHVPPADFAILRADNQVFDAAAMYDSEPRIITGGGDPEEVIAASVSSDLFAMLGVRPVAGRSFDASDEAGGNSVVILSDRLWRRRFAASRDAVGASLTLDGKPYRVIGVMPPGLSVPNGADVWMPRNASDSLSNAYILAKLRAGVTPAQAQAAMTGVVAAITNGRPNPGMTFAIEPLKDTTTKNASVSWLLLLGAVTSVFAIGCVNISNLMLARGLGRRREIDLRLALGASRFRIIRLLVTECALIAGAGGILAVVVAFWILNALRAWAPADTPRLDDVHADPTLLFLTLALSVLTAAVLSALPALQFSRSSANSSFAAAGTAATSSRSQSRARSVLVVSEIALAVVLLVGATLLLRSLDRLTHVDPGFRTDHLLTVSLHLPPGKLSTADQRMSFLTRIQASLRAVPGASSVAVGSGAIMTGLGLPGAQRTLAQRITRDGAPSSSAPEEANLRRIDPEFFQTLGIPIVEGRAFSDADRVDAAPVAIVNRTMALTFWGTTSVVGRRVSFERANNAPVWLDIVGVAADTRDIALTTAPQPAFFVPLLQNANGLDADSASLYIRTAGDPVSLTNAVRGAIWHVDSAQPVADVSTMEAMMEKFVEAPRFRTALLAALAGIGLFLSVIGIYGVVSHGVTERIPEMAVRLALGAERRQIVTMVLTKGMTLAAAGVVIGIAVSLASAHWLRSLLFDIASADRITLVTTPVLILAVTAVACYLPARRAAATDAVRAMRGDAT